MSLSLRPYGPQRRRDMTNKFLADALAQHCRCAGPLDPYIEGFGALLDARGYARATETQKLQLVADFSRWLDHRRLEIGDVDERRGPEVVRTPRRRRRAHRRARLTLRTLCEYLRQIDVISPLTAAPDSTEAARVEQAFRRYLPHQP